MARVRMGYLAVGVALAAAGLYLASVNGATWRGALASRGWPSTTGEVVSSDAVVVVNEAGETQAYAARVVYTYLIDGRRHESNRVSFGRGMLRSDTDVTAVVDRYPEGKQVRVFYNPRVPGESVLEPGVTGRLYGVMGAAAGAVVAGGAVAVWATQGKKRGGGIEEGEARAIGDEGEWQGETRDV